MSVFHIDKRPIEVQLWTTEGDVRGVMHLAPFAKTHNGDETVIDLMCSSESFLPIVRNQRVDLFSKSNILALWYVQPNGFEPLNGFSEHRVLVQLRGRKPFITVLRLDERPPNKERVSDFLNDPVPYVLTYTQGMSVLVAKEHIVSVVPELETPPPTAVKRPQKIKARVKLKKRKR